MMKLKMFDLINGAALIVFSLLIVFPFIILINQSFMSNETIMSEGYTLFPKEIVFHAYNYLLVENTFIYKGLLVSVFITSVGTLFCLCFTCSLAFGLSKKYLPYRKAITIVVLITMFFSGGLIPNYLLITAMGLKDSLLSLIVPVLISPWYMFLIRNFFMEIPHEIEESAQIDGATEFYILWKIVVPISLPAIATIGLFYMVWHWNSWFPASIYLDSQSKFPLQLVLKQIISNLDVSDKGESTETLDRIMKLPEESVKAAATLITSLPIVCVYPFIQKYFVKGIVVGSIKG
ncbi:carbohydrate ABC transporter permease [Paenibacillus sp. J5C_2022]|uniref:carbohydrate ABC transporter permease n=1 Tax=Paenibacillus sp. J5C2022 TaxID=2977129 RepID=UPI0021CF7126|nr:carbohydrate ABC transporter permease [Paenibacillus sp. J5C2022]MCU6712019.1 carbohydrate ABC transporter permease [Paenibacillus sp. J5C2022]